MHLILHFSFFLFFFFFLVQIKTYSIAKGNTSTSINGKPHTSHTLHVHWITFKPQLCLLVKWMNLLRYRLMPCGNNKMSKSSFLWPPLTHRGSMSWHYIASFWLCRKVIEAPTFASGLGLPCVYVDSCIKKSNIQWTNLMLYILLFFRSPNF